MPDDTSPSGVVSGWDRLTGIDVVLVERDLVSMSFGQLGDRGEIFVEVFGESDVRDRHAWPLDAGYALRVDATYLAETRF